MEITIIVLGGAFVIGWAITYLLKFIMVTLYHHFFGHSLQGWPYCQKQCRPDNCKCWDIEQQKRRADLDKQRNS